MSQYTPGRFSGTTQLELVEFLEQELRSISEALTEVDSVDLRTTHVEPTKRQEGMLVHADGVDWNPGGTGTGVYVWQGGAWVKL